MVGKNRKYLWGVHFYWMCDCKAIRDVLEYDGPISMMCQGAKTFKLPFHYPTSRSTYDDRR